MTTTTVASRRRSGVLHDFRHLPRVMRLLVLSQLAFNIGFYMVLPYLATHLTEDLALRRGGRARARAATFSQQGLFVLGGTLTDRIGAKPVVLVGCALRVAGFVLLGLAESLPAVLAGAMLTGFAAALFSPAVESLLAREAGEQAEAGGPARADVFAMLAMSGQVGTVAGPLIGTALLVVAFRVSCSWPRPRSC